MDALIGKILGGRYEIVEKIGEGGMAVVYRAHCHLLSRDVAVKILRPEYANNEEFIRRFRKEAQAAASLSHHNIVNIYDIGNDNNLRYIVMEYIDGPTLKDIIKRDAPLAYERAVNIAIQICAALDHAHKHGIIHRDIKPQNIMLTADGVVKVADFGIAKAVADVSTTLYDTDTMGSVHYLSPEQARGGYVDAKSDIYSLGVVLYEMVTGQVPFTGDTAVAVALKHLHDDIRSVRELNPDVPPALDQVITKALQKDRDQRYDSAMEMMVDLRRVLREPYGTFVSISDSMVDEPTRVVPAIHERDHDKPQPSAEERPAKKVWKVVIIAVAIIAIMAAGAATAMRIYNDYFAVPDVNVPSIVRQEENAARQQLESLGLVMNVVDRQYNDEVPEGYIISQDPQPNTTVKKGASVNVIVSQGTKNIEVPSIVNKTETEAKLILEEAGLEPGEVRHSYSDEYPAGYVMDQNPKAGIHVTGDNIKVDYVVSDGPETTTITLPDFEGQLLDDAQKVLESYGLKIGRIVREDSSYDKDVILRQKPEPQTQVTEGSTVDFWVSSGKPKIYSPKQITIPLPQDWLDPEDPEKPAEQLTIKVLKKEGDVTEVVYQGVHKPSEKEIKINVEGKSKAVVEVYIFDQLYKSIEIDFTKEAS
ncbi:Stk1 family PASTA domain-containing Ser/Thr kinase [Mahella australiensis]|uniref:non-specific serine/threonine protein kinase n=1 Tax=Mahella australiensis (strain DSM 15567 / CIP 107919 / 50-1 BON) TaxID=697281 RepID=F4A2E0_MAHA5|nr:Stk1 family PASTA domain-containing Ser/Thr kinase [Mahella australiensis]AEE96187.1 serine/threonine protein kinase with PASTA sensor(s) [Mahella australiensis 50-1 BON]